MWDAAAAFPEQVARAASDTLDVANVPAHDNIEHVVILGMGGSGMVGDVVMATAGPFMSVPLVVCKSYEPPNFVSPTTLCFAVSFSGDTEETVEAASSAAIAGARMVVISSGGELAELAQSWGSAYIPVSTDVPKPRAALGSMAIPALLVLEQAGLFPGAREWVGRAVDQLRLRRDQLFKEANPARDLARRIGRTIPLIYAGATLGAAAATRWKTEINENAKTPAFTGVIPEVTHNEIMGWGQSGDITRQVLSLVLLRHDWEHPQITRRFDFVRQWTDEVMSDIHEVRAQGDGHVAQLLDLMLFGTVVSLHLADQEGVDPGPIDLLDQIKAELST
jgi:glucose/mannose-6-phosphate isomerase